MKSRKPPKIFSGNESKDMWKAIHKTHDSMPDVFWALYTLGCRCQELEETVRELRKHTEGKPSEKGK